MATDSPQQPPHMEKQYEALINATADLANCFTLMPDDIKGLTQVQRWMGNIVSPALKKVATAVQHDYDTEAKVLVDAHLLLAACKELREWKVDKGGDDQVVLNLEALLPNG